MSIRHRLNTPPLRAVLAATFLSLSLASAVGLAATPPAPTKADKADKTDKTDKGAKGDKAAKAAAQPEKPSGPPPAGSSPMAELKKSNAQLDKLLQKNRPNWSPEAELQREEVRKLVGSFLDYAELAKRALAKHWDGLDPKKRQEFVNTLRELVERSYLKQMHGGGGAGKPNYEIKYDKETIQGNEATVTGTLHTTSRGKKVKIALEYKMLWKNDHWVVYDVVTDEQSMLENYRAEFNKIINKEGFDALLKRMQKKLEQKDE